MTDAEPPPIPQPRRGVPVVGIVLGAWVVLWLLMMWHGDWPWQGSGWLDFGSPRRATLKLFGAFVPADLRWQSFFLAPLLHGSLLGLVFLFFFWRGVGRTLVGLVGRSWTWVAFVGGGLAAAYAHLEAHTHGAYASAVGPFDPILCGVGLQLGWGILHREARVLAGKAVKTLIFLVVFMLLFALGTGVSLEQLDTPMFREAMGAEAMLAALVAGIALAIVIGLVRRATPGGARWLGRGLALAGLLGVLSAVATQAQPVLMSAERSSAGDFLDQLRTVERRVKQLTKRSDAATEERNALALEHGRLVNHAFLEGYDGREALLAYAKVLGAYMRQVDAPFLTEPQLRKRYRTWYDGYEKALREQYALAPRAFDPWEGL